MTDPTQAKQVRTRSGDTTRKYSWPPLPPHEFTVTSVTSAIKGGLPTPHLIGWAAKMTAEAAIRDHDIVSLMLKGNPPDKRGAIAHLKGSRYRDMHAKGDRGTIVHAAVDAYLREEPWTKKELESRMEEAMVPDNMRLSTAGMISGVMEFLWDSEIEVHQNECTLYNRTHGYAGTADIIGSLQVGGSFVPAIIDVKTSKAIYNEVALQLVAYARAEFIGLNDGTEAPLLPDSIPQPCKINHGIVIRPKADGTYERADFTLTDEVFQMFLSCLGVAGANDDGVLQRAKRPTIN